MRNKRVLYIALLTALSIFLQPFNVLANDVGGNTISEVILPTVHTDEDSPFNFILDPYTLVYSTDAERYGGGIVEEGATLLFHNTEGEYDFSCKSDALTATNLGSDPVRLIVEATIEGLDDVELNDSGEFDGDVDAAFYLALIDGYGNEIALSSEEPVYMNSDLYSGESFSFSLIGSCNPDGDWSDVKIIPSVKVTWQVESMSDDSETEDEQEVENEDTVSGIDYIDNGDADSSDVVHTVSSNEEVEELYVNEITDGTEEKLNDDSNFTFNY